MKTNTNGEEIEELYIPNATSSNLGAYSIYAYQMNNRLKGQLEEIIRL